MCDKCGCQKKEEKVKKPEDCSPKQVKDCHGEAKKHPCIKKA